MRVLHVVGKEMKEVPKEETYTFLDGDVYVIDNQDEIWIWIGKDCAVEEQTVGAWVANKLDNEERGGEPAVHSTTQGDEPKEFQSLINYKVVDGDTPGFLVGAELDVVNYKMYRIAITEDTEAIDTAETEEVPLSKSSLNSNDVFVVDGNEKVFTWIGKNAQREEKFTAQKLIQKIDSERNYLPLTYTIYEGEGGKSETGFYELIGKLQKKGSDISIEDRRELEYRPEGGKSEDQQKQPEGEKKGFFARLFSFFK